MDNFSRKENFAIGNDRITRDSLPQVQRVFVPRRRAAGDKVPPLRVAFAQ
jgi:hypothetical protein